MPRRTKGPGWVWLAAAGLSALLVSCGGPPPATPTAIPASVVRPVQPTPIYANRAEVYALLTPGRTPQFVTPASAEATPDADAAGDGGRAAIALYIQNQTPSAVAIAPGGAAIYAERGGRSLAGVPVGGVLTVTGKSADGAWYAVYNDAAVYGWTPAGQLRIYGGEDLVVVEEAPDPAPIATLLAQAAQPVTVLDDLMAQFEATVTALAQEPTSAPAVAAVVTPAPAALLATPTVVTASAAPPAAADEPVEDAETGVVGSEGRLNLRAQPNTAAAIVRKLQPGETVTIVERSADGVWLRVQAADGATGWVAGEFIR